MNKLLYKIELCLVKVIPMVYALLSLLNTTLSYFDIDAAILNISEGEAIEIVDSLKRFTDKEKRLSKYAACEYLNVSRATFDNYVREGKLPRGKHEIGFKELSWNKKELDEFIKKMKGK